MAATLSLVGGLMFMVAFDRYCWWPMQRWLIRWLRDVPELVVGLLGGLAAALYCVHTYLTVGWDFTLWRWLVEWPPFPLVLVLIFACLTTPGRPLSEGRETVPVFAMAGGAPSPAKPSYRSRLVRWLHVPWHRAAFRGAIIVISAVTVLVVRGDYQVLRPMVLIVFFGAMRVVATLLDPGGPDDPDLEG